MFLAHEIVFKSGWVVVHMVRSSLVNEWSCARNVIRGTLLS